MGAAPPALREACGGAFSQLGSDISALAVICFLLRVMSQYLICAHSVQAWWLGVTHEPLLCGVLVFCFLFLSIPPFGAGRYRPGPSWAPLPGLESTISPGSLVSLEWLRNLGVGPVSQHREPCGSWPFVCSSPASAAALSQRVQGPVGPPQPSLEWRFLVWPLGLVDEPEAGTAATSSDALRQSLGTLALLLRGLSIGAQESGGYADSERSADHRCPASWPSDPRFPEHVWGTWQLFVPPPQSCDKT